MILEEWNQQDALNFKYNEGIGIGEQKIIDMLKNGKSPNEIINEFDNNSPREKLI